MLFGRGTPKNRFSNWIDNFLALHLLWAFQWDIERKNRPTISYQLINFIFGIRSGTSLIQSSLGSRRCCFGNSNVRTDDPYCDPHAYAHASLATTCFRAVRTCVRVTVCAGHRFIASSIQTNNVLNQDYWRTGGAVSAMLKTTVLNCKMTWKWKQANVFVSGHYIPLKFVRKRKLKFWKSTDSISLNYSILRFSLW